MKHKSPSLRKVLEQCLTGGSPLLIFDVQPQLLLSDPILSTILHNKDKFHTSRSFKIAVSMMSLRVMLWIIMWVLQVGDTEVECVPGFELNMMTSFPIEKLTHEFLSSFIVVQFVPSFDGLENILCDRYAQLDRHAMHQDKTKSSKVCTFDTTGV